MRRLLMMLALGASVTLSACADSGERGDTAAETGAAGDAAGAAGDAAGAAGDAAGAAGDATGRGTMLARADASAAPADTIEVWKDPGCGCCKNWIEHMEENGFAVVAHDTRDMTPVKQKHDVGADLTSCHTGSIRGYAIEGHVPADLIRKMLDEKPGIRGLAVPGMPIGSPGMEGAIKQKYDVIAFTADGRRTVYATR